jgi:hypothetical protein
MSRRVQDGSKLVVLAIAATAGMVGIGTIWAPFYADRDKIRGLWEEENPTISDQEMREVEAYALQQQQKEAHDAAAGRPSNNMWSRINHARR